MTKIYAIGDSYVAGYGVRPGSSWVDTLEQKLQMPIVNLGINGGWITELQEERIPLEEGDYLLVLGGCNDLLGDRSAKDVERAYEHFRETARQSKARVLILLPPMPSITSDDLFVGMAMIESLKNKLLELYEISEGFSLENIIQGDDARFIDGIHLDEKGHELIADAVFKEISNL
ncbi:GDSL-like protein [Aedoeadaptatus nemausensis]|uniref:GDSL-like protein n=1 Tax=Aedoeadaptatus nemausensis TaxID=2582829 RepID=A0A6V6XZG0_9FIRM|nr:GDSL-type esterase/lipase family protein [Peptoniphilus nemausensis]CAC9924727.1 GDSL-like protein [Peptoniphilus nemausensis]